jgi:hypothetical protein
MGQSDGGEINPPPPGFPISWNLPLGVYTGEVSPWGLWDTSGGEQEWTEELHIGRARFLEGSSAFFGGKPEFYDSIEGFTDGGVDQPFGGLRVASAVPAAPSILVLAGPQALIILRRRRVAGVTDSCSGGTGKLL